jgi:hypothetical protein
MKKIVASVGLVAIGVSGIESASAQALVGPDATKPWSLSATLRGFYDDNTSTLPKDTPVPAGEHKDSFGFEVAPSAALVWSVQQTTVNIGMLYSLKYFDNKPIGQTDHTSQAFTFNAGLTHSFNERIKMDVSDAFVIGQEPDVLRAGATFPTFQRVNGDNIVNHGTIGLEADLTPQIGIGAGYDNAFFDYKNTGPVAIASTLSPPLGVGVQPSLSGALDRIESRAHLEGFYHFQPETKGIIGYQFTQISYTSDELIGGDVTSFDPTTGAITGVDNPIFSSYRNSRQHTFYVGGEHKFLPELSGSVRVGASYTDFYNSTQSSQWSPYVLGNLTYHYMPDCHVDVGFSYDRSASDVVASGLGTATLDSQAAVVFVDLVHKITPYLYGSLLAQFQNSDYYGGFYDNQSEQYYLLGLDLEYRFNQYFSAHAGYNYDNLQSDIPGRQFDRNRVYIGVTATY